MTTPLKSSAIQSTDYDQASRMLTVTFKNGASYHYRNVLPEQAQDLNNAESAGRYFREVIAPYYVGEKVPEE